MKSSPTDGERRDQVTDYGYKFIKNIITASKRTNNFNCHLMKKLIIITDK